jgi:hypothetical protein
LNALQNDEQLDVTGEHGFHHQGIGKHAVGQGAFSFCRFFLFYVAPK